MLNWNYLETFVILSETLNFSETAKRLNTAQPVVSRQIKVLEQSLGYPLFIRTKKKVTLSNQGQQLKLRLGPLVAEVKTLLFAEQEIPLELGGSVRLGSMFEAGQLLLFPKIKKMMEINPSLQVHLTLMSSRFINEAILSGTLDFGFVYEVSDRKAIRSQAVTQDWPVLIADRKHNRKWREEAVYPVIGYREKDLYLNEFIERNFSKTERRKFQMRASVNSHAEILDMMRAQPDLMAVIPLSSAQRFVDKDQAQILIRDKKAQDLFLICNEQILIDKRKKAFWEQMIKAFRSP